MSTSPAEIIYNLLDQLALVGQSGTWPASISFLSDEDDDAVAVYDTAGELDGRIMTGEQIEHPGIQIQVRAKSYPTAWGKANEIALALDNQSQVSVAVESDATYLVANVSRRGAIVPMGIDEKDGRRRHYFSINAVITYRQSA